MNLLKPNANGVVATRIVAVSGTVDPNDGAIELHVGGAVWFTGSLAADGTMSGTANCDGRLYEFVAQPALRTASGFAQAVAFLRKE